MYTQEEIIKGCIKGVGMYQQALYRKFAGKMMGICSRYIKSRTEAEDVFQESFVKVFNNIHHFKGNNLEAWMKRIFINACINSYHRNKKFLNHNDYEDIAESHFELDETLSAISNNELLELINQLPDGYKLVFNLYVIEGYTHKEISELLSISDGTSKSQLAKSKKLLQKLILKLYPKMYENR